MNGDRAPSLFEALIATPVGGGAKVKNTNISDGSRNGEDVRKLHVTAKTCFRKAQNAGRQDHNGCSHWLYSLALRLMSASHDDQAAVSCFTMSGFMFARLRRSPGSTSKL